jgi:phosphatidylserine decarboxylase
MRLARGAWPLLLAPLVLALAGGAFLHPLVAAPFVLAAAFVFWFFRDPERRTPDLPGALWSPADGRIIRAGPRGVSVFMNVFDVHVCRSPMAGRVERVDHTRGRFLAAFKDAAAVENERVTIVIADGERTVSLALIAGLVARRIVCTLVRGQELRPGERIGLIRFGSRVDIALPEGGAVDVRVGDRVVAGETLVARFPEDGDRLGTRGTFSL